MRINFSRNPINIISTWWENVVVDGVRTYYFTHKKSHYKCCVCGLIKSPYFESFKCSLYGMGWHRLAGSHRWICHHCADHGYVNEPDDWNYTWDEWQKEVERLNILALDKIRQKDFDYYREYFLDD